MNNINALHTLYIATMTAAAIMLVITIILFFVFDIIHVTARIFGLSRKKEIKKLSESSSFTNQLSVRGGKNQKIKGEVFTETGNLKDNRSPMELLGMGDQTTPTPYASGTVPGNAAVSQETERLAANRSVYAGGQTTDEQLTTVLDMNTAQRIAAPPANINFTITRQILMIHTDESIEIG